MSDDKDTKGDAQHPTTVEQNAAPERKVLPTARGRPSSVPPGTGFGFGFGRDDGGINRYLMSGADALKAENIIALFEAIKGRKATAEEIANVERTLKGPDL